MPRLQVAKRLLDEAQAWAAQRLTAEEYSLFATLSERLLDEAQSWAVQRLPAEEYSLFTALIDEIRRLRKRFERHRLDHQSQRVISGQSPASQEPRQCAFIRNIGGHQFQCAAPAKHGDFCGHHTPKKLKQLPKGCTAKNRAGTTCKAIVVKDSFCPIHWREKFGHDYERNGEGFRCSLCNASFAYWTVEGRGTDRIGSIKTVARCPAKVED